MAARAGTAAGAAVTRRPRGAAFRRYWTWYLFIAPNLIVFFVFTLFSWGFMLFLSLHDWNLVGRRTFVGWGNYAELLNSDVFWQAARNTVVFTVLFVGPVAALSLLLAALVNQSLPAVGVFRSAFFLPVVTSIAVLSLIWRFLLLPASDGPLNYLIGLVGIPPQEWLLEPDLALLSITGMQIWASLGYYMILWLAGLQSVPGELREAARIDGAGRWAEFWNVTLPMLKPTTIFVVMIATIGAFQLFGTVYLLTGGGPMLGTTTVSFYIWQVAFVTYRAGYGAAISVVLFGVILIAALLQRRFLGWAEDLY